MKTRLYALEEEYVAKLAKVSRELHAGTDRERDFGHQLWLILAAMVPVDYDHDTDTFEEAK